MRRARRAVLTTLLSFFCIGLYKPVSAPAQEPGILRITVTPERSSAAAGSHWKGPLTVQVVDGAGSPVAGASVSLLLPDTAPTGAFENGLRSQVLVTNASGSATPGDVRWGPASGAVSIRITAAKGSSRAGTVSRVELLERDASRHGESEETPRYSPPSRWRNKWTILAMTAAGIVGGGLVYRMTRPDPAVVSGTARPPQASPVQVGPPVIVVGRP
jgi:hypothetical protein